MKNLSKILIGASIVLGSSAHAHVILNGTIGFSHPNATVILHGGNHVPHRHVPRNHYHPPMPHHNAVMPCHGCYVPPEVVIRRHQMMMNGSRGYYHTNPYPKYPHEPIR